MGAHDVQGLALEALGNLAFCAPNRHALHAHQCKSVALTRIHQMSSGLPSLCMGDCTLPSCAPRLTAGVKGRSCCLCILQGGPAG